MFKPKAVNSLNGRSVGLTQIQIRWHREKFFQRDYFDVFENLRVGADIFRDCAIKYQGNSRRALWCYNGHTRQGLVVYAEKVLKTYYALKQKQITV